LAISGTAFNALRVTRTGRLSNWKGLAYPSTAFSCVNASFLAMEGITGPLEIFEGNKGFMDSISGRFEIDWNREGLEQVTKTIIKKYNAEIHSQSAIEGVLELREEHNFTANEIERVDVGIFEVAFNIIGGGEEGDKTIVTSKEEADHSLPYMIAVSLLDGRVMPEQYLQDRIVREDVQLLLRRVFVRPSLDYSKRFPEEMPCLIKITLYGGKVLTKEKRDYGGFHTRPVVWEDSVRKFEQLSRPYTTAALQKEIVNAVAGLEGRMTVDLTALLAKVDINKKGDC
ncbi:MAG: MmgE/PrpD family protein, partial [Nitrospira sp.]|nr:MmgE/PrpD family protein [Nitrospira sp.]